MQFTESHQQNLPCHEFVASSSLIQNIMIHYLRAIYKNMKKTLFTTLSPFYSFVINNFFFYEVFSPIFRKMIQLILEFFQNLYLFLHGNGFSKNIFQYSRGVLDTVVYRLSLLHNLIKQSLKSGSAQLQFLLRVCQSFEMVRTSDRGSSWK